MTAYTPLTGLKCGCRPGIERDNCSNCEGTGKAIDWRAIKVAKMAEGCKCAAYGIRPEDESKCYYCYHGGK